MVPQRGGSVNNGGAKETKGKFALVVFGLAEMLQMGVNCNLLGPREIRADGRREKRGSVLVLFGFGSWKHSQRLVSFIDLF